MRIALVTPYSWSYEGGVNRHVEALAEQFLARGDEVRVLAPWDPPDRLSRVLHRAPARAAGRTRPPGPARPHDRDRRQRRGLQPVAVARGRDQDAPRAASGPLRRRPRPRAGDAPGGVGRRLVPRRAGGRDVPRLLDEAGPERDREPARREAQASTSLQARIAVSQAAARTGRRWFGGEYTVIPNGVDVDAPPTAPKPPSDELRIVFVGRPEERKGLPVLLSAFEELVRHLPARLTVVGADDEELVPLPRRPRGHRARRAARPRLRRGAVAPPAGADVLCAPSLDAESFGMVLIEAFAAGTPVVASAIAGYADVVSPTASTASSCPWPIRSASRGAAGAPPRAQRLAAMGRAARSSAQSATPGPGSPTA